MSDMNIRFDDRSAIVTGAAHGFGREIALRLAGLGASVWACDIIAEEVEETAAMAEAPTSGGGEGERGGGGTAGSGAGAQAGGGSCVARVVDVTDREAVRRLVAEVEAEGRGDGGRGGVDILVNDAGGVLGQVGRPLEEVSPADWQAIFDVNTTGAFYCTQAVAPGMKAARHGRIVNVSSGAGLGISRTGIQAYAAAKAAQIGLTRQLAHELGPWGITVNNVAPGFVRSNPTTERQWQAYGPDGQRELVESIALKRLGSPADIAHAVLFLASDFAGWITGEVLSVSGGR